jgi:hypothetical protein
VPLLSDSQVKKSSALLKKQTYENDIHQANLFLKIISEDEQELATILGEERKPVYQAVKRKFDEAKSSAGNASTSDGDAMVVEGEGDAQGERENKRARHD